MTKCIRGVSADWPVGIDWECKRPLSQDFLDDVLSRVLEEVEWKSIEPILRFFRFPFKYLSQRGIRSILASEKIGESLKDALCGEFGGVGVSGGKD